MSKLVLLRHGESQWNLENRFTGWVDVDLSPKGQDEARRAGKLLSGFRFDIAFTSLLKRAVNTLTLACSAMQPPLAPVFDERKTKKTELRVVASQALNERNYGDLQGKNKTETAKEFGEEQVHIWRRSYEVRPPHGESLEDTVKRALPYYQKEILPLLQQGKNVLIVAHGNSLRALSMELDHLSKEQIPGYEIATGVPIVYEIDGEGKILKKAVLK